MFLLIDNYDSFTYNLYALSVKCGINPKIIKNREYYDFKSLKGIIISPGPSSPENSGTTLKYIRDYQGKVPVFGVCLGMQSIGYFLGYNVGKASNVVHGKVSKIKIVRKKVLFKNISETDSVRYHSLSVKIPEENEIVTAVSEFDNEVMAIEDTGKKLFGVQFHPESYLSKNGEIILNNFIKFCRGE